jgi:hypothetical protein
MNPCTKKKWHWTVVGGLVGVAVALVAACCCHQQQQPATPPPVCADAGAPPAITPAPPDASEACDASDASTTATPIAFDAGPSCGTHPWSHKAQDCCPPDSCD